MEEVSTNALPKMGICVRNLPAYITDIEILPLAVSMTAGTSCRFQRGVLPNESQDLVVAVQIFQKRDFRPSKNEGIYQLQSDGDLGCFDLRTEVPKARQRQ
jgi:hypothetical protein